MALDRPENVSQLAGLVDELCGVVDGFKVGLPLVISHGPRVVHRLRSMCPRGLWVADFKLADIGYTMRLVASTVADYVDAFIAHAFVGVEGALAELKDMLDERGRKLVLVVSMSHPGSREVMDKVFDELLGVASRLGVWGVVAPATRPAMIRRAREALGPGVKILSPGVGAQGARPGDALCAGADYEIVGRAITGAEDPAAAAEEVKARQDERLRGGCRA